MTIFKQFKQKYLNRLKNFIIICGHYGSGKTNLALNMAFDYTADGQKITLVDLDIVNPYFRSADYKLQLAEKGIKLIAPAFAGTNLDIPVLPPEIINIFNSQGRVIIDVGGDDAGAVALGRYAKQLEELDYDLLYVINKRRLLTSETEQAAELLRDIEAAGRVKATAVINNTHLQQQTDFDIITDSFDFAEKTAAQLKLPLLFNTIDVSLYSLLKENCAEDVLFDSKVFYPIKVYVNPPWV